MIFIGGYVHGTMIVEFPTLIALSICYLVKRWALLLSSYNIYLKNMDFHTNQENFGSIFQEYIIIEKNLRILKETLSIPLLLCFSCAFVNSYIVLSELLQLKIEPFILVEICTFSIMDLVFATGLTICCSMIPENMLKIKTTAGILLDRYQLYDVIKEKEIHILKRIEGKNIIHLTAGDMINIKKSLFLSYSGTLLTYGLLIYNLD
ncbi:hypothetical protein AVEN_136159-1 [Araneus ventricosus]|uniref:Gustatory receptor n=1 Tax=Araneus ventricosus TaxID=182803 RepID=A0A4Y2HNR3_ARAVE|nr:hypothetical protein AVEN_22549-1 [Araneus ventricosus]GBM66912.1 hypothetical protein AVEN_136159-1 [Araneus ventricosus]